MKYKKYVWIDFQINMLYFNANGWGRIEKFKDIS